MKHKNSQLNSRATLPTSPIKDTEVLLKEIKEATNIYTFLKNNTTQMNSVPLPEILKLLLKQYSIKKSEFIYMTNLSRSYLYEVFSGKKVPSRDKLISMILAIGISVDEANKVLQSAGYTSLYAKDLRDAIILFGLQQKMPIHEVNDILYELNIELLE